MSIDTTTNATYGPNPPKFVQNLFNRLVTVVLRSPLHTIFSSGVLLLTYTGRKSGKSYTFPVGYVRKDKTIIIFPRASRRWWKNLQGGSSVTLLVKGQKLTGLAQDPIVNDPDEKMTNFLTSIRERPASAKFYGVKVGPDGQPEMAMVAQVIKELVLIKINLAK